MERNDKVIAAISFLFLALISFLLIRMEMGTIRDFVMNKNAVKKAKKGQTFWEWLIHKRFRAALTEKYLRFAYIMYIMLAVLSVLLIFCIIINFEAGMIFFGVCVVSVGFFSGVYFRLNFKYEKYDSLSEFFRKPGKQKLIGINGISKKVYYENRRDEQDKKLKKPRKKKRKNFLWYLEKCEKLLFIVLMLGVIGLILITFLVNGDGADEAQAPMDIILGFFIFLFFSMAWLHWRMAVIRDFILTKKKIREMKKGQGLWSALTHKRFRDIIPKRYLWFSYTMQILFAVLTAFALLFWLANFENGEIFLFICMAILFILVIIFFETSFKYESLSARLQSSRIVSIKGIEKVKAYTPKKKKDGR